MTKNTQRGNVLFLILIAVALFAALSYAVTQTTRGGGDADEDKAALKAAQILQWHATLRSEVLRFSLRSGIPAKDIRVSGGNSWTPCSTGTDCLWAPEGGGLEFPPPQVRQFTTGWSDSFYDEYAGSSTVSGFNNPQWFEVYMGSTAEQEAICQAYNDLQNLGAYGTTQNAKPGNETACYLFSGSSYTIYFVFAQE